QLLAKPLLLGNGNWLHALELRFLLSAGAARPPREELKKKKAYLIEVQENTVLVLNLIIGSTENQNPADLPHELLPISQVLWNSVLRGGRPVVLTARLIPTDQANMAEI